MVKRKNGPKSDEFVEDSDVSEEEEPVKKKVKKEVSKAPAKSNKKVEDSEGEDEGEASGSNAKVHKVKDGEWFMELEKLRRVSVSSFRGKGRVDIREYYEKDGTALPGKKGISLSKEQYQKFKELIPIIDGLLEKL